MMVFFSIVFLHHYIQLSCGLRSIHLQNYAVDVLTTCTLKYVYVYEFGLRHMSKSNFRSFIHSDRLHYYYYSVFFFFFVLLLLINVWKSHFFCAIGFITDKHTNTHTKLNTSNSSTYRQWIMSFNKQFIRMKIVFAYGFSEHISSFFGGVRIIISLKNRIINRREEKNAHAQRTTHTENISKILYVPVTSTPPPNTHAHNQKKSHCYKWLVKIHHFAGFTIFGYVGMYGVLSFFFALLSNVFDTFR